MNVRNSAALAKDFIGFLVEFWGMAKVKTTMRRGASPTVKALRPYIPLTYPSVIYRLYIQPIERSVTKTTLFLNNRSQAVRLPKDVAFPEGVSAVAIVRDGARRVIVPADALWDDFFESPGIDIGDRAQPQVQVRKAY